MNPLHAIAGFCTVLRRRLAGPAPAPLVSSLYDEEPELAGLVEKFIERFPEIISEMNAAAARADWPVLREQTHNLKGVGGGCGFPQVSRVAARIELAASRGDPAGVSALLSELQQLAQRIARGRRAVVAAPLRKEDG